LWDDIRVIQQKWLRTQLEHEHNSPFVLPAKLVTTRYGYPNMRAKKCLANPQIIEIFGGSLFELNFNYICFSATKKKPVFMPSLVV
jgi:hypothetical protein